MLLHFFKLLALFILLTNIECRCAFSVGPDNVPIKVDTEPFLVEGLTMCVEYNGKMGCCASGNDIQQSKSYGQIDGIFGSGGGACDACAINLKRFWCEYACSPNQSDFAEVAEGYVPMPSPQKPDEIIDAQIVTLTVEAETACDLFGSCKRNGFVSSVSAMSSPAGFLNFQGHNALDEAFQYINVKFSYNKSGSLYFSSSSNETTQKELTSCSADIKTTELHGFPYKNGSCTCNNCETSCKNDEGFIYEEPHVFEDFSYVKVGSVWVVVLAISITVTTLRKKKGGNPLI